MTDGPTHGPADPRALPVGVDGDRVALGLAVIGAVGWLATAATESLVLGLLTVASMAALLAVATHTAVARRHAPWPRRLLAGIAGLVAAAVFVVFVDATWSWAMPAVALAAGLGRRPARRTRAIALAVSAATCVVAWVVQLVG